MATNPQTSGMRGVYLVAAELARRGYIASPTSRSAFGADILVTDRECRRAYSVQVKTNARTFGFWLLSKRAKSTVSPSHIYVLVNIRRVDGNERPEYYVVPSRVIAKRTRRAVQRNSTWYSVRRSDVERYRDKWSLFGVP